MHKFTSSGTFLTRWGGNGSELGKFGAAGPGKIAIDQDDRVHVLDSSNYRLQVFDRDGTTVLGEFGYPPVTSGIIADFVIDQTKQLIVLIEIITM